MFQQFAIGAALTTVPHVVRRATPHNKLIQLPSQHILGRLDALLAADLLCIFLLAKLIY